MMLSILREIQRYQCRNEKLFVFNRLTRCYAQDAIKHKHVRERPLKSKLADLVHGEPMELEPAKLAAIREIQERKKRAQFAQETADFGYLLRPHMEKYFADLRLVLEERPSFLQERVVVLSFLGLDNVKQLENSYTVDQQVEQLLEEGKLPYAVHLCRMAKEKGSVGMNKILQHLIRKGDHNTASQVYNSMKKWGCTGTERTPVILSRSTVKADKQLDQTEVHKMLQAYEGSMSKAKTATSKLIISNAMLETLARTSSVTYAFAFYNDIPEKGRFSRDKKTYTTILSMISHQPLPLSRECISMRKSVWEEVQKRISLGELDIDSKLVDSYSNSLAMQTDPEYYRTLLAVKEQYFINDTDVQPETESKFPFTSRQFDILLKSALNTGQHEEAAKLFDAIPTCKHVKLDLANYHNILRNAHSLKNSRESTEKILKTIIADYESGNQELKPTSLTIHLVWRNYLQSQHKEIDLDGVENIIHNVLPRLRIPIDEIILSSYVALYHKVFSASYGRRPGVEAGLQAVQLIKDNLGAISEVSSRQKNPQRVKRALINALNICGFVLNHPGNRSNREKELVWVTEVKESIQGLIGNLTDHFGKKKPDFLAGKREFSTERRERREFPAEKRERREFPTERRERREFPTERREKTGFSTERRERRDFSAERRDNRDFSNDKKERRDNGDFSTERRDNFKSENTRSSRH